MTTDWASVGDEGTPAAYAPNGLRQQRTPTDWSQVGGTGQNPWLSPGWQTGGQSGTTANAFNDDFYSKMYEQYDEEQQKIQKDSGYVSNLFLRKDFTGIVGWDQTFTKDDPTFGSQLERDRSFRTGDIYNNGEFQGNVYDEGSNLSIEEANAMVAPHIFGAKAADKYKEADGDQEKLKNLILQQGAEEGKKVTAYTTRVPSQEKVDNYYEQWDQNLGDEALIVGGGAGAGALLGASIGSIVPAIGTGIGAIVGGVIGGVGSWLDQDRAREQAALAFAAADITMESEGADAGFAQQVNAWSALGMTRLDVLSNLTSGFIDLGSGDIFNNESETTAALQGGNVGTQIGMGVTGFLDAAIMSASPLGRIAYMGTMGGVTASTAYNKLVHDGEFDQISGSFHKYENWDQRLSGYGSSAIDVGQTLLPAILARSNALGIGGARTTGMLASETRAMDMAFRTEVTASGTLKALSTNKAENLVGWLAPSTAVSQLSVRASAMAAVRKAGRTSVDPDDLLQAALRLERSSLAWKAGLINGFGEAAEEVAQVYLTGRATGWAPETNEYVQAAVQGFTMGAGMTMGARMGTVSQDKRSLFRANTIAEALGEPQIDPATWAQKAPEEKARLSTPTKALETQIRAQRKRALKTFEDSAVSSVQGLNEKNDALRLMEAASNPVLEGDSIESMSGILPFNSPALPSHQIFRSLNGVERILQERLKGLRLQAAENPAANAVMEQLRILVEERIAPLRQRYEETGETEALEIINETLRAYWNSADLNQKQAVELVFSRSPNDNEASFQMLLPQVDIEMTAEGVDGHSKLSQSYEKLLSHDNDGDRIKHMARHIMNPETRTIMREGLTHWAPSAGLKPDEEGNRPYGGSGFLNIAERDFEPREMLMLGYVFASPDIVERNELSKALDAMVSDLGVAIGSAVDPATLKNYRKNLETNPTGAKAEFYRALAKDGAQLFELAHRGNLDSVSDPALQIAPETSIGLWIEDFVQRRIEDYRESRATREVNLVTRGDQGISTAQPPQLGSDVQSIRPVAAQTMGQTNDMRSGGSNSFRAVGGLAYTPWNSRDLDTEEYQSADLLHQAQVEWYTTLTRLRPFSEIRSIRRGSSPVVREARQDLENLARYYYPDEWAASSNQDALLFQIANLPMWQATQSQVESQNWDAAKHTNQEGTVAQLLLRDAADRLEGLTPPQLDGVSLKAAYSVKPARAMYLLLQDMDPSAVLSKTEADHLGSHTTFGGLVRRYTQLAGRGARKEERTRLEVLSSYRDKESLYRQMVDAIRENADTLLAHGDENTGAAVGELADKDRVFHAEQVSPAFESLSHITYTLGLHGEKDPQAIVSALERDTEVIPNILRLFSPEMRVRILQAPVGSSTQTIFPGWFFDLLTSTNAEQSAMIFWNAMLDMEIENHGMDTAPSNSWVSLWQSLTEDQRARFNDMRTVAPDVQSFVNQINRELSFNRPPLLAWQADTILFSPEPTSAGWQWAAPSAERRQAIRDANAYLVKRAQSLSGDLALSIDNVAHAQDMLEALNNPRRQSAALMGALTALKNRLQQAKTFNQAAMGPAGVREFVQFAYRGLDPDSAAKGKPSPAVLQFGDTDARRDATSLASQFDQELDAALAVDAASLKFNPQRLTGKLRIQTADGTTIQWDPLDERSFLELFVADDGAYQGLLWDVLLPSVYEEGANGRVRQQYLLPKDLQAVTQQNVFKELFTGIGTRSKQENDELFISFLNAMTPDNKIVRFMSKLAIARTTGERAGSEMSTADYNELVADTASILRSLSGIQADELLEAQEVAKITARQDFLKENPDLQVEIDAELKGLGDVAVKAREAAAREAEAVYNALPSDENAKAYVEAIQAHARAVGLLDATTTHQLYLKAYNILWDTPAELVTKTLIRSYLEQYLPELQTMMTEEDREALLEYALAPEGFDGFKNFGKGRDQDVWNKLSEIVAYHRTVQDSGYAAASWVPVVQSLDFAAFDPTWTYLLDDLFDSELHGHLRTFADSLPGVDPEPRNGAQFYTDALNTVLRKSTLGLWTPDIASQTLNASRVLGNGGAATQVAIGGLRPQIQIAADKSAARTNAHPPAEMAHSYSIDIKELRESLSSPYDTGLEGDPWILLENASVVVPVNSATPGGPTLVIRDTDGNEKSRHSLHNALYKIQRGGTAEAGSTMTIRGITHAGLVDEAVKQYTRFADRGDSATVELQMFRPQDKPADAKWANNIHFDGTLGQFDVSQSLYSALLMGNDGVVQRLQRAALDSIKGSIAIFSQPHERGFDAKDPAALASIIADITRKVMHTQIGADYFLADNTYRAVYRMVRDRLIVVGRRGEEKVVLSSEQALTEGIQDLENASVIELSRETLETLRGSTSGSGHPQHLAQAPLVGGEGEVWLGSFTPYQLERVPNLGVEAKTLTQIAEALRPSGLLSTERTTTYQYKNWTAESRVIRSRRFEEFDDTRRSIKDERRSTRNIERLQELNQQRIIEVSQALKSLSVIDEGTVDALMQSIGEVTPNRQAMELSQVRSLTDLLGTLNSTNARYWIVDPRNRAGEGYLPTVTTQIGPLAERVSPVDDVMQINLDGYDGNPESAEWQGVVRDEIARIKERGLGILLIGKSPATRLQAEQFVLEGTMSYTRSNTNLPFYVPLTAQQMQQTVAARRATFVEHQVLPLEQRILEAYNDDGYIATGGEGGLIDPEGTLNGLGREIHTNIVPTRGFAGFDSPHTAGAGQRIQFVLETLNTPEGWEYLASQSLRGQGLEINAVDLAAEVATIRPLVEKALRNLNPLTGFPRPGTTFEPGDLIAGIDPVTKRLSLTRWGWMVDQEGFDAQKSTGFNEARHEGIAASGAVIFVGKEPVSQDKASLRGGIVESWESVEPFGWRAIFRGDMTLLGAKLVDSYGGKKSRNVFMPENKRPERGLLGNTLRPARYDTGKAARSKGIDEGMMVNAREAIAAFGWDAARALANDLGYMTGHPNPNATRWTISEWSAASPNTRAVVTANVRAFLENTRMTARDRISNPDDVARAVFESTRGIVPTTEAEAESAYMMAVRTFLRGDGATVDAVLGAPGMAPVEGAENPRTIRMPSALTQFIDSTEALRDYVRDDMNSRMGNIYNSDGTLQAGWLIRRDWRVVQKNSNGREVVFTLRHARLNPTGEDHSEIDVSNAETGTRDTASNQSQQLAGSIGLDLGYGIRDKKQNELLAAKSFAELRRNAQGAGTDLQKFQGRTSAELKYRNENAFKTAGLLQPLDRAVWGELSRDIEDKIQRGYESVSTLFGVKDERLVDALIRTYYRAGHDPKNPDVDKLHPEAVLDALQSITTSLRNGHWPTSGGLLPGIHADLVALIAQQGSWWPDNQPQRGNRLELLLQSALDSLWFSTSKLPPEELGELDGLRLSYEKYHMQGITVSGHPEILQQLIDEENGGFTSSLDPLTNLALKRDNHYEDFDKLTSTNLIDDAGTNGLIASKSEGARRRGRARERGKNQGGTVTMTVAEMNKQGRVFRDKVSTLNSGWKTLHAIRTVMPMLNPYLWAWNPADVALRYTPAKLQSLITGSSTDAVGRFMRDRIQELANRTEGVDALAVFRDAFGIQKPYIDEQANNIIPNVLERMNGSREFYSVVAAETRHRPDQELLTAGDTKRQAVVDWAAKLQDVTHGMAKPFQSQMYLTNILEHQRIHNPDVEAVDILLNLRRDPLYYLHNGPREAHEQAIRNIQNIKGAKLTTLGAVVDRVLIPMAEGGFGPTRFAANTLLFFAKFRNFAFSSTIMLGGLQGVDAVGTILMQALAFKKSARTGKVPTDYLGQTLESYDIADAFIRSGLSHTGLFVAALTANAIGLTGESEEERRQRRLEELAGLGTLYDPRDVVNDFRNRDAIWLEGLKNTPLGFLSAMYAVDVGEGQEERSPAKLHWTVNFFVAPTLGVAEFLQSGDWSDVTRGFESALGQMPLINTNFWWDAVETSNTLYAAAANGMEGEPGDLSSPLSFLIKAVGTFEKALLENAFVNEIVAASDEFNRNPWAKPDINDEGRLVLDADGQPTQTDEMVSRIETNPDSPDFGKMVERRVTREYEEGLVRAFTANNQTAAFLMSLLTGSLGTGESFMRQEQVAATTTLEKTGLNNEDAELLLMSVWDPQNEQEVLTRQGAERILDSLFAGTVKATDPALQNIYITGDQRAEISESLLKKIYTEGVTTLGLTSDEATQRMWDIWSGPANRPNVTPLSDVVWGNGKFANENGIPWKPVTTYRELNTTFAMGPDGKLWATGVARHDLMSAVTLGLLPTPYYGSAVRGTGGNLGVDETLNSTDVTAQLNTGYRGLTRVDDSLDIPDEADIIKKMDDVMNGVLDEIKDLGSDLYKNGYGGGYRFGGGGGGGGGYASNPYMPFQNAMRNPYLDNIPQIYINNVNVRRTYIRRERFSSDRGRVNQWQ